MLDAIIGLFEGLGAELTTFIISMLPVVELRGAIPAIVNINLIHWPPKSDPPGGADVFLDLTIPTIQGFRGMRLGFSPPMTA